MPLKRKTTGTRAQTYRVKYISGKRAGRVYVAKGPKKRLLADGSVPERIIQASILSWLESTELLHWRQNSGKVPIHGRLVNLGPDGISDIVVVVPPTGRFMGLEVKSAKGTLRPVQKAFRDRLIASGGHYAVVRSLREAQDAVAYVMGVEKPKQCMVLRGSGSEKSVMSGSWLLS